VVNDLKFKFKFVLTCKQNNYVCILVVGGKSVFFADAAAVAADILFLNGWLLLWCEFISLLGILFPHLFFFSILVVCLVDEFFWKSLCWIVFLTNFGGFLFVRSMLDT
jgi:hypothetical protein